MLLQKTSFFSILYIMVKSKKQRYKRRKTVKKRHNTFKQKPKHIRKSGMHEPLGFFTDFSDAKNSMIGVNKLEKLKDMINYTKKDISELEEDANILKAYLRYNKNKHIKVMPSQEVKDILGGKDLYDMPEPTPRREAQRYYDLLEAAYLEYDYHLKEDLRRLERMKRYSKRLKSYHRHAKKYEKQIGVYESDAPTGHS